MNNKYVIYASDLTSVAKAIISEINISPYGPTYFTVLDDWEDLIEYSGKNYQSIASSPMFDSVGKSLAKENIARFTKEKGFHKDESIYQVVLKVFLEMLNVDKGSGSSEKAHERSPQSKEVNDSSDN